MAKISIDKLLEYIINVGGSDLHICVDSPPVIRLHGRLRRLDMPKLEPEDTLSMMKSISSERSQMELNTGGGADFGFAYQDKARFRVSIYKQKGSVNIVLRTIPKTIRGFEDIGIPMSIKNMLTKPRGLILVTGPTGSGKTSTLACMIDFINTSDDKHILTIEDPIEYYHDHKKSIISQREVGNDVPTFAEGVRRGLRQDPDVILIGEMRDLETTSAAISAAETGHLVFGTMHTTGAGETVDRIIDQYPQQQQAQIRAQLGSSLVAVISQLLLSCVDGKSRAAAFELMYVNSAIENLIRENKTYRIRDAIQTSRKQGMITLDDYLLQLFTKKKVAYQEIMKYAQDPVSLQNKIKEQVGQKV